MGKTSPTFRCMPEVDLRIQQLDDRPKAPCLLRFSSPTTDYAQQNPYIYGEFSIHLSTKNWNCTGKRATFWNFSRSHWNPIEALIGPPSRRENSGFQDWVPLDLPGDHRPFDNGTAISILAAIPISWLSWLGISEGPRCQLVRSMTSGVVENGTSCVDGTSSCASPAEPWNSWKRIAALVFS